LIVLGGVQNALDDANHPDLPHTVALIRAFAAADKAVLGICLGAQIVARAFGARNILGLPIEFGWREVEATAAGRADPVLSAMGASAHPFHWHTDTFDLPAGAVHLAKSAQTVNQGFRIGRAVYGIQFHFEADRDLVRSWCEAGHDDIAEHTPDWALRHARDSITHGVAAERVGRALGEAWIRQITSG